MAYTYAEIRSFQGLFLQQNSFQVPDGAMEEAKNVVIKSDDVITKTNGFYTYWQATPLEIINYGAPKATVSYQGKVILFSETGVGHFNETFPFGGTFNAAGTLVANDAMGTNYDTVFSFEQNANLYFTSLSGIRKLETYAGAASKAGVPPGLTLKIDTIEYSNTGYITSTDKGSQTAYRLVFGRRDTNGNLLLSAPSDIVTAGIPKKKTQVPYTIQSFFGDKYVVFAYDLDPYISRTIDSFVITDATAPEANGSHTYEPVAGPGFIAYPVTTVLADGTTGTLSIALRGAVVALRFEYPSELEGPAYQYFYQLYRTKPSDDELDPPLPDFALIIEKTLTAADYASRTVRVEDFIQEQLKGASLYTNPNTGEGELEENSRPPLAKFCAFYKNYAMYANIQTVQRMALNLVDSEELIGVDLIFKSGVTQEVYRAVNPSVYTIGNVTAFYPPVFGNNPLKLSIGLQRNFPVGSKVLVTEIDGTLIPGEYTVTAIDGSGVATFAGVNGTAATVTAQFVSDGTARLYNGYGSTYNDVGDVGFKTVSQWTAYVAQELCRAINIYHDSLMYANYRSGFNEFPGSFTIESKEFIDPIYLRYSVDPGDQAFIQNIPFSFGAGIQFYSDNDVKKNWVCPSKVGEPEAVPVLHNIPVGSASAEIVGVASTRDSFIVLKEDGAYRIRGDIYETMIVEPLDLTVKFIKGTRAVLGTINNTIIAFCNQGIVQVTDTSVQLISRRIEDVIQPLIGRDLSRTVLHGHEADRLFFVSTEAINAGQARKCWVYNVLNQSWTEIDKVFDHMSIDPNNALQGLTIDAANSIYKLWKQRRTNTRIDWCGDWAYGSIETDSALYPDKLKGTFTITGGQDITPEEGDVILAGNIFNRITAVSEAGGVYTLTFAQPASYKEDIPTNVFLYKGYESVVKFAPFHAGLVGRLKHFAQMQIHMRQQVITDLFLDFSGSYFNGSDSAAWRAQNLATVGASGWGFSPWGQFPWGLTAGANLKAGTEAAAIIRTLVPRFAARSTFIQPRLKHSIAGQPMLIQALSWSIHSMKERVSR